jgi:formiminoglutamate deiminase
VSTRWFAERAWLGGDTVATDVLIEVEGELITAVTPGASAPGGARPLAGLTVPGLANAHSHAFHRALRGRAQDPGDFWSWRDGMYRLAAALDPDLYLNLATAVYAEMALAGITAVGEFHYVHHRPGGRPFDDPNAMGHALMEAAARAGIRLTLLDTLYLRGGFDEPALSEAQSRFSDGTAEAWMERVGALDDTALALVGAAVHSVRAVGAEEISLVASWSADIGRPLHVHASEQRAENAECVAATGLSPVGLLASAGALGPATTVVHGTHLSDEDIGLLGRSGTAVCFCPTTERELGDGIGPAAALVAAGASVCLGSDSHAVIDLFEEARAVEVDERLKAERRGHHSPAALLAAATETGSRSLGWPAGRLAVASLADFVTVDLDSVRTAGIDDPVAATVFAASSADVGQVVVGGRLVVDDGHHLSVDDVPGRLSASIAALWRASQP